MSKLAESIVDSGKGGVRVVDEMLDDMKTLKECIDDLQKDCENKVYEAKKAKMYPKDLPEQIYKMEQTASELLANTASIEDKYIDIMNDTNKLRETENLNQKKMLTFYYTADVDFYEKQKLFQ